MLPFVPPSSPYILLPFAVPRTGAPRTASLPRLPVSASPLSFLSLPFPFPLPAYLPCYLATGAGQGRVGSYRDGAYSILDPGLA